MSGCNFTLQNPLYQQGQGPFSVGIAQLNFDTNMMSAVTLKGHPLAGWRYWRVFPAGVNDLVVETGAVDAHGPGPKNFLGYYLLGWLQLKVWQREFEFIANDLRARGAGQQGSSLANNMVRGEWGFDPLRPGLALNTIMSHIVQHLPSQCTP
jgi:hypothetical protein